MSPRVEDRAHRLPRYPDLAGKVAVVTGGSRGIGAATARALAANGVDVAVVGRDEAALAAIADSIEGTGTRAIPLRADCTHEDEVRNLAGTLADELGAVDILAAFAGGNGVPVPTTDDMPAHWREVIDTDLTSTFLTISAFLAPMVDRGRGSIVTMSSAAGRQPARSNAAYAAAKAGVAAATLFLASDASSWITGITLDIAGGKIMI